MIGRWTSLELAGACQGEHLGASVLVEGIETDTRADCQNKLFVALKGERFDAHDFVGDAVSQGATAVMVEREFPLGCTQIVVGNTLEGLGRMAAANRDRFKGCVIAVTGSVGKTTVKEMVASILAQTGEVCKTKGNLNNHIGVPLSLLQLTDRHECAVFELGASGKNEIAYTVAMVKPAVAVINNAVASHVEGFGSLQGIVQAKGEIVTGLESGSIAVLNADDAYFDAWVAMAGSREVLSFGLSARAQVRAENIDLDTDSSRFDLFSPQGEAEVNLPLPGQHNVRNALAAAASALAAGIALPAVVQGLAEVQAAKGRMNKREGLAGTTVLDDTYNANPSSMKAALDVLARYPGHKVAVLGHMGELGEEAEAAHEGVGTYAREVGIDEFYVTGAWQQFYARGFGTGVVTGADNQVLIEQLRNNLQPGAVVLVKGSRSARMEEVVKALADFKPDAGGTQ